MLIMIHIKVHILHNHWLFKISLIICRVKLYLVNGEKHSEDRRVGFKGLKLLFLSEMAVIESFFEICLQIEKLTVTPIRNSLCIDTETHSISLSLHLSVALSLSLLLYLSVTHTHTHIDIGTGCRLAKPQPLYCREPWKVCTSSSLEPASNGGHVGYSCSQHHNRPES